MGLRRGHRAKPLEWLAEQFIFFVSLSAILMIFLIFIFIGREAMPIVTGQMNSALSQKVIPVEDLDKLDAKQIREYLGLTREQHASMDRETLKLLMELKIETSKQSTDKDAALNTTSWRFLLRPYQWSDYSRPEYIW